MDQSNAEKGTREQVFSRYTITETLFLDGHKSLYRVSQPNLPGAILEVLAPGHRPTDVERLWNERRIGAALGVPTVLRPLRLEHFQGLPFLVFEDFAGQPLCRLISGPMSLERFLCLAVRIAGAVADLHALGVMHKDLRPEHILVEPASLEVKLAGLGLATRLPREEQPARPPTLVEGSPPFLSPEQTGRTNRLIDSRTDLYSLGVTFYLMLTGRLPFEANDPLEWIHCHVARAPPAPSKLAAGLPEPVDRIVLKLLAKMADDRYQSARGLQADLARCLEQWRSSGRVDPFPLGERDVPERLRLPERLYGRDAEVAALLEASERVAGTGFPALVLISGYSGIGKSSLARELQKPIAGRRGLFAAAKFDQIRRDVPYSTVTQAFRELVFDALPESPDRLASWRHRLQEALGPNGQLIVDLVPPVGLLVGPQPPIAELPLSEAESRLRAVFRRFCAAFASEEHPLTLFLDDLQWADAASLNLLADLVAHPDTRHLLLVGAFRDNEVDSAHPLMAALERVRKSETRVQHVVLGPLSQRDLAQLVADAVHCASAQAAPLASLVWEKTAGNPFFAVQFLTALHRQGLVAFDGGAGRWTWDVEKIRAQGFADNVAELVVGKLRHLPADAQEALKLAACFGAQVDAGALAVVLQRDPEAPLKAALEEDMLVRLEHVYRFPHDRVQEAAYSLIPPSERAAAHLAIGRRLLAQAAPAELEEKIFEIVNQLNRGAPLIASREERERVAELDLFAARRAKASTAYASALEYLVAGGALLAADCWERRYDLVFELELHRAECEYLTGEMAASEARLSMLAPRAADIAGAAAVACAQLALYTTLDRSDLAVAACLEYLARIGVHWSPHPAQEEVRREYEHLWRRLGDRSIEELIDLPPMAEPACRATLDVLTWGQTPALFTDRNLLCLLVGRMANLSLEHGNGEGSCLGYVWLGMVLGSFFGDHRAGYRFGKLGFDLLERHGALRFKARAYVGFGHRVMPWTKHLRAGTDLLRRAFDTARENGELTYASFACNCLISLLLAAGDPLEDVQREAERALEFVRKARFGLVADILLTQLRLMQALRGLTPLLSSFEGPEFGEARFERHLEADPRLSIAACWYWIRKLQVRFHGGDEASAVEAAGKAERLLWASPSFFEVAEYHFYGALALAAYQGAAPAAERPRIAEALEAHRAQIAVWAESCPDNFETRLALVDAEIARLRGEADAAASSYELAIRSARDHGFVQNEAIAYETAARFYRGRGFTLIADTYLREARERYLRWGALGKVRQLDRLHPAALERRPLTSSATIAAGSDQLDLLSVFKASQTISGEILVEKLVGTLLQVILEQGGGQKVYLLLACGGGSSDEPERGMSIEAEANLVEDGIASRLLPSLPLEASPLVPVSIVQQARLTREPVILDDAVASAGRFASDPYLARNRPRAILCLPILRKADLVGVFYLENNLVAGAFTPDRLTALSLLATQAAISMENAQLLSQEKQARQRWGFLAQAGALLSGSLDFEETLRRLSRLCVQSLATWCSVDVVDSGEIQRLAGAHADPAKEPLLEQLRRRYPPRWGSPHPAARVLGTGQALLRPELTDEDLRAFCVDDGHVRLVRQLGSRSGMAVPIRARGQVLAALTFCSEAPRRFQRADLELAEELAQRAGMAIENARLYREAQRAVGLRDEFLSIASHELRTPIQALQLTLQALERSRGAGQPPSFPRMVTLAVRQAQRLTALVDQLLDVGRIQRSRLTLTREEFDLAVDARQVLERMQVQIDRSGSQVMLRADSAVSGRWDRSRVDQLMTNLLSNALAYGAGKPIDVIVERIGPEGARRARIAVRDRGIGIPADRLPHVFERFERATSTHNYGGLGLGLFIAREIAKAHGGTIEAESEQGRGSSFTVELPLDLPGRAAP